jgi:hypothetical protein
VTIYIYIYISEAVIIHTRTYYKKYCKILSRVIKEAKRQNCCTLIAKSDNKIKTTWNITKCQSGKLHLTEQIPSVLINSEKINDPQIIAYAFNTFFLQITENLSLHQEECGDVISFLKNAFFPIKFPGIKTIPTTKTEIKSIIHSIKAKKNSSGYDGTSKILEVCAFQISYPLTKHGF